MRRKLIAGNWKMNGSLAANAALLAGIQAEAAPLSCDVAVCVPAPYLAQSQAGLSGSPVAWGGQDLSVHESGAYTGEVSAAMLREFGCRYVIVGHSERRAYHAESNELVAICDRFGAGSSLLGLEQGCSSHSHKKDSLLRGSLLAGDECAW